jgi:hypothetical protein
MAVYKNLSSKDLSSINIETMPISAFSASFVRKLVNFKLKDQFNEVYKKYLSSEQIEYLYNIISTGLRKPEPKVSSSSSVVTELKYDYPVERGEVNFNTYYAAYEAEQLEKARLKALRDAEKAEKERLKEIKEAKKVEAKRIENLTNGRKKQKQIRADPDPDAGGSRKTKLTKRRKTKRRRLTKRRNSKRRRHH